MNFGVISSRPNSNRASASGICEDADYLTSCFEKVLSSFPVDSAPITFISGGGRGPETFAKTFAEAKDFAFTAIPPRTKSRGSMAFPERNRSITAVANVMIIFWGGEDMYIANAISEAMFMNKPVFVFPI